MAIQDELKLFVEEFKKTNGRIPTQNEIVKGTGRAAKTIKSYLVEGVDYAKPLTKLEAAKLGGKKRTGITKVDSKLFKELKDLTVKGISPSIDTSAVGSKAWRVKFDPKLNLKTISLPATKENLEKIKTMVSEVVDSDNYNKNILPFQTSEEKRKIRRYKEASYKKKDPFRIYYKLSRYKGEKFPGSLSKDIVIQHGQPKFTTQTLSKFALIPSTVNISETVEKVERLRNNALKIALATLNNKNADVATKKAAAEKYNSIARGLRGQLKGEASGVVNFELLEVDDKGGFKKIKDIGFDPKRALVASDKDLSKITKEEAEELLKLGKEKIDAEAVKLKLNPDAQMGNLVEDFTQKVKSVPGGCRAIITKALGGPIDTCEAIIKSDPEKAALKLNNAITATKGPLKDLKEDSQKLIRLYRGEGFKSRSGPTIKEMSQTFDVSEAEAKKKLLSGQWFTSDPVAASSYTDKLGKTKYVDVTPKEFMNFKRYVDRVNKTKDLSGKTRFAVGTSDKLSIIPRYKLKEFEETGKLKSERNIFKDFTSKSGFMERAEGVLSYDSVKGGFVDPADPTTIVNQDQIKAWAEANPEKVTAGTEAVEAATNKSVISNVARSLARVGAPLPVAAIDSYFIGRQVADGKGTAEIASNPINWLGLATMEPLAKASGIAEPGKLNAILRLGLNPATIRGITRFAGLPGLAISTALTAYDQYQKYKDGEGFIFNLLNQKGTE